MGLLLLLITTPLPLHAHHFALKLVLITPSPFCPSRHYRPVVMTLASRVLK